jgi:hypothetical protein
MQHQNPHPTPAQNTGTRMGHPGSFMQFAKDSFFLALQERLAGLNPARTITLNGTTMPAILVLENQLPTASEPLPNTYYIEWAAARVLDGSPALMGIECTISYSTWGSVGSMVDRGRVLGQLDEELLEICQPGNTEKRDYTQAPSVDLGTAVFWSQPVFEPKQGMEYAGNAGKGRDGSLERRARLTLYFFSEVTF